MKLDTEINLVFTNNVGGKTELKTTFKYLIENDEETIFENLEEDCTSSGCNNESQNFCDCSSVYEDYEITDIQIL